MTLKEEIKRPFNLITLLLTIISLGLSVIFYFNGKKDRAVSYQLNTPVSKIFDRENSTPSIKLLEKDTILVTQNVYLLTGKIWNSGDLPIAKEDVRQKMSITLNDIDRILDFKIIKQIDPIVSKFKLTKSGASRLDIDWAYFDPSFGFNFQILYIGKEDPKLILEGKLLDVKSFKEVKKNAKDNFWLPIILIVLYSLMILFLSWRLYTTRKDKWRLTQKVYPYMLTVCIGVLVWIILTKFLMGNSPPF